MEMNQNPTYHDPCWSGEADVTFGRFWWMVKHLWGVLKFLPNQQQRYERSKNEKAENRRTT